METSATHKGEPEHVRFVIDCLHARHFCFGALPAMGGNQHSQRREELRAVFEYMRLKKIVLLLMFFSLPVYSFFFFFSSFLFHAACLLKCCSVIHPEICLHTHSLTHIHAHARAFAPSPSTAPHPHPTPALSLILQLLFSCFAHKREVGEGGV